MGKKVGGYSWLTALKKVFWSPNKDKNRQCNQEDEEEKKREKRRKWLFRRKVPEDIIAETTPTAAGEKIITLSPPSNNKLLFSAILIQTAFRGYLAKKVLVALKGIVKLQALIRGQNVRRQAQRTLRCMQAMFRVQAQIKEQCARISLETDRNSWKYLHDIQQRKSTSRDQCLVGDAWRDYPPTLQEIQVMIQAHKGRISVQNDTILKPNRRKLQQQFSPHCSASPGRNSKVQVQPPRTPSRSTPKPVQVQLSSFDKSYSTANTPCRCPANRSTDIASRYSTSGIVPSYMGATECTKARGRSQSAPRLRHTKAEREWGGSVKKRLSYSIPDSHPLSQSLRSPYVGMEQQSDYSCNTDSIGGEISPSSTPNLRW